jgi:NAD(P)H-flavin reductase
MLRALPLPSAWQVGPAVIVAAVAGYAAAWFAGRPAGQPTVSYVGQFLGAEAVLLLSIGLASAPHEPLLRFAVKALGDDTSQLHEIVKPGMPAVIGGPFGRFSYHKGTSRQVWIVGGIGVTPFLSTSSTAEAKGA